MKIFDTKSDSDKKELNPDTRRKTAILHQTDQFKIRVIKLPPGESIQPCEMVDSVIFHVLSGSADITVNGEKAAVKEGQGIATGPAIVSMKSKHGARLLGIQIQTSGQGEADG